MEELKKGMYVRVTVDYEDSKNSRMFAMGQIQDIDGDNITIEFYRNFWNKNQEIVYHHIPKIKIYDKSKVKRCKVLKWSKILYICDIAEVIVATKKNDENYYEYYVKFSDGEIDKIEERFILADFNRCEYNPYLQMKSYEFHNPFWYSQRKVASESINMINNFGSGFKTLISSRTYLLEHQIDTIVRGLNENECRLMLADEVGLGKTIEALVIMKGLKKKKERVLLLIPDSLVNQWKNELENKFWIESVIFNGKNINSSDIVIMKTQDFKSVSLNDILDKFDYCIIDEVHRLVREDMTYKKLLEVCKDIKNVLLLSATPIQNRQEEYLKLLKLLKPTIYGDMTEDQFTILLNKNLKIKKLVYRSSRNLDEIYDDRDEDDIEEVFEYMEEISELLEDACIDSLVKQLDINSEDLGEGKVREILAYISTNYQFEKNIIRHRREEIKEFLPNRNLDTISYEMQYGGNDYYEGDCYESVLDYIEYIKSKLQWDENIQQYIRILLNSMFSSPWALKSVIDIRKTVNFKGIINSYYSNLANKKEKNEYLIKNIKPIIDENKYIENIEFYLKKWTQKAENEIENMKTLMDEPDLIMGRIPHLIDYLEQELYDKKVVIFTSWPETLEKLKVVLDKLYGENSTSTFYIKNNIDELEENVQKFQSNEECRFMLCDELGGEGRNFQNADAIVHLDLPFSPTVLEQRIGRLDRIGRRPEKEVLNIIVISQDTVEMSLFNLWNDGLNIFKESLSGLEIALDDINKDILNALQQDIRYGLNDTLNEIKNSLQIMKENIEEERYYDMARQLDYNVKKRYDSIINHFDKDGGKLLADMMLSWCLAVGFKPSYSENGVIEFGRTSIQNVCMEHTTFAIPDTKRSLERSIKENSILGTFDRNIAINNEHLVFFAPGEEIFESIMNNVEEGYRGKCAAIEVSEAPFEWEGIVFTYNVNFNVLELLDNKIDIKYANYAYGHMPIEQYISFVSLNQNDVDIYQLRSYFDKELSCEVYRKKKIVHLGKRDGDNHLQEFKKKYGKNQWNSIVYEAFEKSQKEFNEYYKYNVDLKKIKHDFSAILAGNRASKKYYNDKQNKNDLREILTKVMSGILYPQRKLDSVLYIKMVK